MRGRPNKLSPADKHELRRYREAGVSIARLASMWHLSTTRVYEILAELRAKVADLEASKDDLEEQPEPADWDVQIIA